MGRGFAAHPGSFAGLSISPTPQRRLIVETLLDLQDHLSAEDLYRIVKRRDPAIGLATVYRTLICLLRWLCHESEFRGRL